MKQNNGIQSIVLTLNYILEVLSSPFHQTDDMGHEAFAQFSDGVFYPWGNLWIDMTSYKTYLLQTFQRLGQHFLRAVRHVTSQIVEAHGASIVEVI